jgi:chromosome segregation ATPase
MEKTMAMESILKELESRIEELVDAHGGAVARSTELEEKVTELETKLAEAEDKLTSQSKDGDRITELETQRSELGARLEKVLELVDGALAKAAQDS